MHIEAAIRTVLLNDEGIRSLIVNAGSPPTYRYKPVRLAQGTPYPNIAYRSSGGENGITNEGPDGLSSVFFSFDVFATDFESAVLLANLVKERLHGFSGSSEGFRILLVTANEPIDLTSDDDVEGAPLIYRRQVETEVHYRKE
jgi:hypothetical protein